MTPTLSQQKTSLKDCIAFWEHWLSHHPDEQYVCNVLDFIDNGIPIGHKGPESLVISDNWPSSAQFSDEVTQFIQEHLQLGNIGGPLTEPYPPDYRSSPLGAFRRRTAGKVRVIHDLSWPPSRSVNDFISAKDFTLTYTTVDKAADLTMHYLEPWLVKLDLKSAFLSCPVRKQDQHLLGFSWPDNTGSLRRMYFKVLPFGLRSSPAQFNVLASALLYIMIASGASYTLLNYLDDYIGISSSKEDAANTLHLMLDTIHNSGFKVQPSKTLGPERSLEFLGIEIDTVNKQLKITQERMEEIRELLSDWLSKSMCTKRDLLSIIGKLSFCARVVRAGKMFLRRLIELSKKARNLHHKLTLTSQVKADLRWWSKSIQSHNGITWLDEVWDHEKTHVLYTDASNVAIGSIFGNSWAYLQFTGENQWLQDTPIVYKELYAVVFSLSVFGNAMAHKQVKMYTDNMAVYHCINQGTSKEPKLMGLLRALYHYTVVYNIHYKAYWLSTVSNAASDSVSRLQFDKFRELCPQADKCPTSPVPVITDF